ncbi:MAG TPA: hypothetical protein VFA19_04605 [Gaiellaceae bacterium]|nr:hypothetical protein [Gaiellaceae bacterium]
MQNPELLLAISTGIAVEVAHLRWIVLTQWRCRACGVPHLHCACKPAWLRRLL